MARHSQHVAPGPKRKLNEDKIVDVALKVLADAGPSGLSWRRLSQELGVGPATLYSYFDSKNSLEAAMVARALPQPRPLDGNEAWHEHMRRFIIEIHDAFTHQPGIAEMLAARSVSSPAMDGVREHLMVVLTAGGLTRDEAITGVGILSRYILGSVVIDGLRQQESETGEVARLEALPTDDYPLLHDAAAAYPDRNSVNATHAGLDLILRGLRDIASRQTSG